MPLVKYAPHGLENHPLHIGMFSTLLKMMEANQKKDKNLLFYLKNKCFS